MKEGKLVSLPTVASPYLLLLLLLLLFLLLLLALHRVMPQLVPASSKLRTFSASK